MLPFALLSISCSSSTSKWSHPNLSRTSSVPSLEWPGPVVPLPPLIGQVKKTKMLNEIISPNRVIVLELTEQSLIGEVTDLLFYEDEFYILDKLTCHIFVFDNDGKYRRRFGGRGYGPGEFEHPVKLRICYDGQIGVCDMLHDSIYQFNLEGNLVRQINLGLGNERILPGFNFIWPSEDCLVLTGFPSDTPTAPWHAVLDGRREDLPVRFAFGERHASLEKAHAQGMPMKPVYAFEPIGNLWWIGSPFTTEVQVFDQGGRFVANLGRGLPRNHEYLIHPDDHEDINQNGNRKKYDALLRKAGNERISRLGDLVLVKMGPIYDIYDINGNLLKFNLPYDQCRVDYSFGNRAVMVSPPLDDTSIIKDPELRAMVDQAGITENDNPFLVVFHLVEPLVSQKNGE